MSKKLVPVALSSEIDEHGKEHIHAAGRAVGNARILRPLSISGDLPDGFVGDAVSGTYTVSGGVRPYGSVTVASGTFPSGLTLATDGSYSGTFNGDGDGSAEFDYSWAVEVTDSRGTTATVADSCVVANLTVSGSLPDGAIGETITPYDYTATDGVGTITFTVSAGALPTGLSMDSAGQVTGTLTTVGSYSWTVTATDTQGNFDTLADSAEVAEVADLDPNLTAIKYLVVAPGDTATYYDPAFDDSSWDTGVAPFSNKDNATAASVGFPLSPGTVWPLYQKLWFRADLYLEAPKDLYFDVFLDDEATFYLNGVQVYSGSTNGNWNIGAFHKQFTVAAASTQAGLNQLTVMAREIYGGHSYLSFRVTDTAP